MKKTYLLTLLFCGLFFVQSSGQTPIETRRWEVHTDPNVYCEIDSNGDWLDIYSSILANYLKGENVIAIKNVSLLKPSYIPSNQAGYAYLLKGRILRSDGENLEALQHLDSARTLFEKEKDVQGLFFAYVDLLEHYRANAAREEAKAYIAQLEYTEQFNDINPEYRSRFKHRAAALLLELDMNDKSVARILEESIELAKEADAPWQLATALLDLGYCHHLQETANPVPYFKEAALIFDTLGYTRDWSLVQFNLAREMTRSGDHQAGLDIINTVQTAAAQNEWGWLEIDCWKLRAEFFAGMGDIDKAMAAYHEYHEGAIIEIINNFNVAHAEMMAELGTQTARNDLLKSAANQAEIERAFHEERSTKQAYITAVIVITLLFVVFTWFFFRTRRLNLTLLNQKNLTASANQQLEQALVQRDMIFREMHHRIKNNLATLSGLLYLQERSISSPTAKGALVETRNRIQAMAVIHRGLYQTENVDSISLQPYLEELTPNLIATFGSEAENVLWTIKCETIELKFDLAVPVAMIINELLTNALKHAFKGGRDGCLDIIGEMGEGDNWTIVIRDDGPGLPEGYTWQESKSLGMKLIRVLSEESGIELSYSHENNTTTFTLKYEA